MPPESQENSVYPLSDPGFWQNLFSPAGYMPRRICGIWTQGEIWLHTASDFFIWTAYLAIPIVLIYFWWRRRGQLPFQSLLPIFGLFIISCGTTHLMEIVMFYYPIYRFAGLVKLFTAAVSWGAVMALVPTVPKMLAMRSPDDLEAEVRQRTSELEAANQLKDELLQREFTARLEAEKARAEAEAAREEAEAANRAKDEFLMTLSHELRTPLNSIQGWASLLQSSQLNEATRLQALQTIERNSWAQARLIDDLLEVSRITTGKLVIETRSTPLAPIIRAALEVVAPTARTKGVHLESDIQNEDAIVNGDAARLQQVVWNLLSNAVKFTPKDGSVKIALTHDGTSAYIKVSDTGEGIAPEFLPHVFDRFRQADSSSTRRAGGLGLGLAIVRHLTEIHGGTTAVESAGLGQGSTFTVTLPLYEPVQTPARLRPASPQLSVNNEDELPDSKASPSQILRDLNILVVDDEAEARTLISTILTLYGANTKVAGSSHEAWNLLQGWKPDLLVSDVGMPEENGYQLIERIRASGQNKTQLPALAMTAYASTGDRETASQAGFNSHLAKPVIPVALVTEVALLAGRAPVISP